MNTSNLTYHFDRKHPEEQQKVLSAKGKQKLSSLITLSKAAPFLLISYSNHGGVRLYDKTSKQAKQSVNVTAQFTSLNLVLM